MYNIYKNININILIFMSTYKDPIRKVGSQSEVPSIMYNNNDIIVNGYQRFSINKQTNYITYHTKMNKFNFINELFGLLNQKYKCTSLVDIGCSSGLSSFIANNNNFTNIISLDHDPDYIETLKKIKEECKINTIKEYIYSFGEKINQKFDVVFCGAIIHWIFSLTANFRNFDSIISYLCSITNKYLAIEWVDPNDGSIKHLNHINRNKKENDEEYNTINFERALNKKYSIILKKNVEYKTRTIYLCEIKNI